VIPAGHPGPAADLLVAARACYGWLLACAPRPMLRAGTAEAPGTPDAPGPLAVLVTRVLGARHLAQALLTATADAAGLPPAAVLAAGAAVDTLHAASMAGLAVMSRPLRRAALTDAALETTLAALGLLAARGGGAPQAAAGLAPPISPAG
jgi:hypothetical protein